MAKIVLIAGLALCAVGVLGIGWQFLRRPRRRRLRQARAFYRRAVHLLDSGDQTGAVAMAREAVTTWTEAGPTIASPRLVAALARLSAEFGAALHDLGRDEDAVIHLAAAEAALRDRADAAPARFRPRLAAVLALRAAVEGGRGEFAEALRYDGQVLPLLHLLCESDEHGYALPLARALAVEARHFYEVGRLSEALASVDQALARLRALPERERDSAAVDLAHAAADRAVILLAAARDDEALAASQEAVGLRLGAHDPQRPRDCLALNALGESLLRLGRPAHAIAPLRQAVELARSAVAVDPGGTPWLATCLSTLSAALAVEARGTAPSGDTADGTHRSIDKDMAEEALATAIEAERQARSLAESAAVHQGLLALAECSLARAYEALGLAEDARQAAYASVRRYDTAAEGRGSRFAVERSRALAVRDRVQTA